jgi:hypothetical protein
LIRRKTGPKKQLGAPGVLNPKNRRREQTNNGAPELAEQTKSLENFTSPRRARDRSPSNDAAETT